MNEAIIIFVTFAAVVLPIVAVVGLLIWWVLRSSKKTDEAWASAAQEHGLHRAGKRSLTGTKYGVPVHVRTVTRGSGDSKTTYTVVSAALRMSLDLGLNLRRHGFFNNMFHKSADVEVGHRAFDDAFIVSADEASRVMLLFDAKLRQLLLQHLSQKHDFSLTDHGVSVECVGETRDRQWLSWAIELCARATSKMDIARSNVPPAAPLAHHRHAWRAYATANGMACMDTPLCMWGDISGQKVQANAVRTAPGVYELEVSLKFAEELGLGLGIEPTGLMDKVAVFFGSQDHRFDDLVFDDTFRVKVTAVDQVDQVLDQNMRGQLMMLHSNVGPLSLDDAGIAVRLPNVPRDPAIVPRTVQKMIGVAETLSARRLVDGIGPYR
jgi:hypothetical protein